MFFLNVLDRHKSIAFSFCIPVAEVPTIIMPVLFWLIWALGGPKLSTGYTGTGGACTRGIPQSVYKYERYTDIPTVDPNLGRSVPGCIKADFYND